MALGPAILILPVVAILMLFGAHAKASNWSDSGVDPGIGLVGIHHAGTESLTIRPKGFRLSADTYPEDIRKRLTQITLHKHPSENSSVVARFEILEDGTIGIRRDLDFYSVQDSGIPLGDGTYALAIKRRHGHWMDVTINHTPYLSGWVRLSNESPLSFWLWYYYFDTLVKAKQPVFFITPVRDDLMYQPNDRALTMQKDLYELEDTVMLPHKLEGPFMLVTLHEPIGCNKAVRARFQNTTPIKGWIRWLQDDGRPRIFRYIAPACN
jgi:hypothetical protein